MNAEQLKSSILQYAIQGKLVPQDPNDEPAEILLQRIKEEKDHLIKEKIIKKEKPLPTIDQEEIPFEIPGSWEWVRLGEIVSVFGGKRVPAGFKLVEEDTGYKYIRVSDMKNGTVLLDNIKYLTQEVYNQISKYTISKEDLYITVAGTIGDVGLVPKELNNANLTENANKIKIYKVSKEYMFYMLKSPLVQQQIKSVTTKVGQPKLAIIRIKNLIVPLPPLNEQLKIATIIKDLFVKADEYSISHTNLEELQNSFPERLEKSILHYAIQGKLVPQDPNDEPAEILLQRIKEEKDHLIKEKIVKKEKPLPTIVPEEIPFEIPNSWKWARLGDLCAITMGQSPSGETVGLNIPEGIEFHQGKSYFGETFLTVSPQKTSQPKKIAIKNSIVMSVRAPVGDVNIIDRDICIGRGLAAIRPFSSINLMYLYYVLRNSKSQFESQATGSTFKAISSITVHNHLIPLPPLNEQKYIVHTIEGALGYTKKL